MSKILFICEIKCMAGGVLSRTNILKFAIFFSLFRLQLLWFFTLVPHWCGWDVLLTTYHKAFLMSLPGGNLSSALLTFQIKPYLSGMDLIILTVKHRKNLHLVWLSKQYGQGKLHLVHENIKLQFHRLEATWLFSLNQAFEQENLLSDWDLYCIILWN